MLPVQFILLLILASLPGALDQGAAASSSALPAHPPAFPWMSLASMLFCLALTAALAVSRARGAIRKLDNPSASASAISQNAEAAFSRARWLTILITGVYLTCSGLPPVLFDFLTRIHFPRGADGQFPILPETIFILPAVLAWIVIWTAAYFLQSATHEKSVPFHLARALPVHEMPTLGEFLSMQARHNFFPYVFLLLEVAVMAAGGAIARHLPWTGTRDEIDSRAQVIGALLGPAVAVVILPWLLIPLWSTVPLTGPLRERLDRVAARHHLRFRNILIWRTHHMVLNAAILGWVPFARYFLMSDALLESVSDQELEAVFAHEVGHGVHWHIPWYFLTIGAAFGVALGATGLFALALGAWFHVSPDQLNSIVQYVFPVFWLASAGLSIPFIAPRFENQADWFACRHMASMIAESRSAAASTSAPAVAVIPAAAQAAHPVSPLAETVTIQQYQAGNYPHAAAFPPGFAPLGASAVPAHAASASSPAVSATPSASPSPALLLNPQQAGAELFISALDGIVETSHRDRTRRGWMHPSISGRIALLRDLATYPAAARLFNRRMLRLRIYILLFVIAGAAAATLAAVLPDPTVKPEPHTPATASVMPKDKR